MIAHSNCSGIALFERNYEMKDCATSLWNSNIGTQHDRGGMRMEE